MHLGGLLLILVQLKDTWQGQKTRFTGHLHLNKNEYRVVALKPPILPQFAFTALRHLDPLPVYGIPDTQKKKKNTSDLSVYFLRCAAPSFFSFASQFQPVPAITHGNIVKKHQPRHSWASILCPLINYLTFLNLFCIHTIGL